MSHQASSHTGGGYKKGGVAPAPGAHKKESNAEMAKLLDTAVRVKCLGGRELRGTLRGYDDLINLVLDDCDEFIRDPEDLQRITDKTRKLGLVVIRGTQVSLVSPQDGMEEIANPFLAAEDDDDNDNEEEEVDAAAAAAVKEDEE